jgi:site-specific recombinase
MLPQFLRDRLPFSQRASLATEILLRANPKADLAERAEWLTSLFRWLRDGDTARTTRLRYLLQLLGKNPEWRANVGNTLRSLLRDAGASRLFAQTGYALETGLFTELGHRILSRILPAVSEHDLLEILHRAGWDQADADWIEALPADVFLEAVELLRAPEGDDAASMAVQESAREALLLLGTAVAHWGLSAELRARHSLSNVAQSPFLRAQAIVVTLTTASLPRNAELLRDWEAALGQCRIALKSVYGKMETAGVSVALVYRLEVISASLQRMDELLLLFTDSAPPVRKSVVQLVRSLGDGGSVRDHLRAHFYLLSRKIVERNGHSGEHYLAENRRELRTLFLSAIGGGVVVVLMTTEKIFLHRSHLPPLPGAIAAWMIYAAGFLVMQFAGLTLATKLPSFLAAHLARSFAGLKTREEVEVVRRDFAATMRSQIVALLGNLSGVIPCGLLLVLLLGRAGISMFPGDEAIHVVGEVHPWKSLAIFLGALTGLELWISSLAGGWFENWLVYRRVPEAIRMNPTLRQWVGERRAATVAHFIETHSGGISANLTLGFLFGFVPLIGLFLGVNTESRHVTIASTNTLLAIGSLPEREITAGVVLPALLGLALVGFMNFTVSFSLALSVAARASGVKRAWLRWFFKLPSWMRRE